MFWRKLYAAVKKLLEWLKQLPPLPQKGAR